MPRSLVAYAVVRMLAFALAIALVHSLGCGVYKEPEPPLAPDAPRECSSEPGLIWQVAPSASACFDFQQVAATCAEAAGEAMKMSVDVNPWLVKIHPESNGTSYPATGELIRMGYTSIYGECWCDGREILLASVDWSRLVARNVLCHELGHAILGCYAHVHDHDYMRLTGYEAKANELNQRDLGY